jgi:hypothetical protein
MSEGIDKGEGRKGAAKLLGGGISCIVGILFGAGGILFALLGASANVSSGAVGRRWASWATSSVRGGSGRRPSCSA